MIVLMDPNLASEYAALVALLRTRPAKMSWPTIAQEVAVVGSAIAVWETFAPVELLPAPGGSPLELAKAEVDGWMERGLKFVSVLDRDYPRRLLDIQETPPMLFVQGRVRHDDQGISVVGSRKASAKGLEVAKRVAEILVERGLSVIAGLAAGIDTAAHSACLNAGGRTVAFLGTGITKSYPAENRDLQQRIAADGLLVSQFLPDAPPSKSSFPMRNATMSGYGLATIVIEASENSGTRIQARVAVQHGRPVILTDDVATKTDWGKRLVGRPGVHVASGFAQLADQISLVQDRQSRVDRALETLVRDAA